MLKDGIYILSDIISIHSNTFYVISFKLFYNLKFEFILLFEIKTDVLL